MLISTNTYLNLTKDQTIFGSLFMINFTTFLFDSLTEKLFSLSVFFLPLTVECLSLLLRAAALIA